MLSRLLKPGAARAALSLVAIFFLPSGMRAHADGPVPGLAACTPGQLLGLDGRDAMLARGYNFPNWDPDHDGFDPDDSLLAQLRAEGFTHLRLPVDGEKLMPAFSAPEESKRYLASLEEWVERLLGLGYAVSIDMHPAGRFQNLHRYRPQEGLEQLVAAWQALADASRAGTVNWPADLVYFELLNEPVPEQSVWWSQAQQLVTLLNDVTPGRRLIVGPAEYQRYEPLLAAEPLEGDNLVYAMHFYDPMAFTHQAMSWSTDWLSQVGQVPFPADASDPALIAQVEHLKAIGEEEGAKELADAYAQGWTAERIKTIFAPVGDWSRRHGVPVIVNEFGVLDFDVDPWARMEWLKAVRDAAEENCLGWTHWEFSDGFGMVDTRTTLPDPFILDALVGQP